MRKNVPQPYSSNLLLALKRQTIPHRADKTIAFLLIGKVLTAKNRFILWLFMIDRRIEKIVRFHKLLMNQANVVPTVIPRL